MKIPKEYEKRYDIIKRSSGKAFADQWLDERINGKKKSSGKPARRSGAPARRSDNVQLSDCAARYLKLTVDPFVGHHDACFPIPPSVPSRKFTTYIKGTGQTGTATFGYVVLNPHKAIASDLQALFYSDSAYAGTTVSDITATTGVNSAAGPTPYTAADFGPDQVQVRLIAAGLRCRYVGKRVDMGGTAVAMRETDNQTLVDYSKVDFLKYSSAHSVDLGYSWLSTFWVPSKPNDYDYSTSAAIGSECLGVVYDSPDAGMPFDFEAYCHYEVVGRLVPDKSPSYTDSLGAQATMGAFQQMGTTSYTDLLEKFGEAVEYVTTFVETGTRVVSGAASNGARLANALHLEL